MTKYQVTTMAFKPFPLKTCLRYPGGKSKALKALASYLPDDISEFRDPFLGGGSVPLMVTQNNPDLPIWVNDKYFILYNFWCQLQKDGQRLADALIDAVPEFTNLVKWEEFHYKCRDILADGTADDFDRAVAFYVVNKTSYSGLTERGSFSKTTVGNNISETAISKLPEYGNIIQNWKITNEDYSVPMLKKGKNVFVFLDPPYDIKSFLYGGRKGNLHQSFSHEEFANNVDKCPHRFAITYNVNEWITNRYNEYQQTHWQIRYSMNHRGEKGSDENIKTELLIHNYNLPEVR
jgi:DNA adenine methylase